VRRLGCAPDGALALTSADGTLYRLSRPGGTHVTLWILAALMCAALLVAALLPFRRPAVPVEPGGDVRRRFRPDVPFESRHHGDEAQRQLVDGLVAFLDNPDTRPPVTLSICGEWGSGKSSIMGAVRSELAATGRYIHVWFNAWRFQREAQITHAFYQTILDEFRRQAGWMLRLRVLVKRLRGTEPRDVLGLTVPAVVVLGVLGVFALLLVGALHHHGKQGIASAIPLVGWTAALLVGAWQKVLSPVRKVINVDPGKVLGQLKGRVSFVRDIKSEFESVFTALGDSTRLVVFVDDLDRCPPDRVADMLEALNMLADTRQAFVVLAIEPKAVERSVEIRFKDLLAHMREQGSADEARRFGARYVEKMVTVSVNVPRVTAEEVHAREAEGPPPAPPRVRLADRLLARAPLALTLVAVAALVVPLGMALRNPPNLKAVARRLYAWVEEIARSPDDVAEDGKQPDRDGKGSAKGGAHDGPPASTPVPVPVPASVSAAIAPAKGAFAIGTFRQDPPEPFDSAASVLPPIAAEASSSPSAQRLRAERWRLVLDGTALALALAAAAVTASFVARRRRMSAARPPAQDSPAFRAELARIARDLEPNPRNAIRFTNQARFLYHLVRQYPGDKDQSWEAQFFTLVHQRWTNAPAPTAPDGPDSAGTWVGAALDRWLPRRAAPPRSSGPERTT
jgi:hypothetical protein